MRVVVPLLALTLLVGVALADRKLGDGAQKKAESGVTAGTGSGAGQQPTSERISENRTSKAAPILPADSKVGRSLARMQAKRQADSSLSSTGSRRNEDPWFLDQAPYPLQPYRFVYNIKGKNGQTEQYRQEVGDGKYLSGSYGYVLPDGIYRHVDYVADDRGFRAFIRTSEPGTANENPSNVVINSNPVSGQTSSSYSQYNGNNLAQAIRPTSSLIDIEPAPLVRRPPGSIVNTPLRNFSSFAYQPPADSFGQLGTPLWRGGAGDSPPLPGAGSASGNWIKQADDEHLNRIPRLNQAQQQSGNLYWQPLSDDRQQQQQQTLQPLPPSRATLDGHFQAARSSAFANSLPNKLAYDRPFSSSGLLDGGAKLAYDNNHASHPDSALLAFERARHLAQLDQLNRAANLHYLRPLSGSFDGSLGVLGATSGELHQFRSESSSSSSERRHQQRTEELGGQRQVVSKQHLSGSSKASGREFELHHPIEGQQQQSTSGLLPPPPPAMGPVAPRPEVGGVKGGGGRLQAPYAGFASQQRTTSQEESAEEERRLSSPLPPLPPLPPTPPEEPQRPAGTTTTSTTSPEQDEHPAQQHDEQQADTKGGVKGRQEQPASWRSGAGSQSSVTRSVRVPEELRSGALAMGDLRSMRNTLGLPQPPRLAALDSGDPLSRDRGSSLADRMLASRMGRMEALLARAREEQQQQQQQQQQASIQRSVAVSSANEIPGEPPVSAKSKRKSAPQEQETNQRQQQRRALSTGPILRLPAGSASSAELLPEADLGSAGNVNAPSSEFEARRLSSTQNRQARLQAEKVSELEKFQQRLRTQQLLLEQIKNPATISAGSNKTSSAAGNGSGSNNNSLTSSPIAASLSDGSRQPNSGHKDAKPQAQEFNSQQVNSHVKYDEDANGGSGANELPFDGSASHGSLKAQKAFRLLQPKQPSSALSSSGEGSRLRRQPESSGSSQHNASLSDNRKLTIVQYSVAQSQANATGERQTGEPKLSDFAQQIQRWPSLLHQQQQNQTGSNSSSAPINTINLDFINSVTALSVDQLNPFAIASVNPAVQPLTSAATSSGRQLQLASGVATSSARFISPPELLAISAAKQQQLEYKALAGERPGAASGGWASNHRLGAGSGEEPAMLTDGFEIRANNHQQQHHERSVRADTDNRFYEVVSSLRPNEGAASALAGGSSSSFQAFKDAQLSILASTTR